ncbi:MAG TPA: D-cysteine desulfhydrase family protein [Thermoflexia bacterium]|nr:D-cysteine desulfhydrase family protein [Thermoflexia bacterium]
MTPQALRQQLNQLKPLALGEFPTPLASLPRLSAALGGPELWIKRDDLSGLGLGGNKIRKLRYLLAEALRHKANVVLTAGAQQSNHARQTAAAAASVGLRAVLVLRGEAPHSIPDGNYLLDHFFGAEVRWAGERLLSPALHAEAAHLRQAGARPYIIPYGGSNALGACGFVAGLVELVQQAAPRELLFDAIIVASSSGGTQAGLTVGAQLLSLPTRIIGISIDKPAATFRQQLATLATETAFLLNSPATFAPADFTVVDSYLGGGYGVVGELERQAIRLLARTEGLLTDPVYTGRALGGLVDLLEQGTFAADARLLFWHTGGSPSLFAYAEELLA